MFLRYGPTDDHVQLSEAEIDEQFGKQDIARVFVKRGDLTENEVERGVTEMSIVETTGTSDANAEFGGILRDIAQSGSLTEFIVESFERYARDALPTPGGERWEAVDDSTIISDGVSEVSQLSAGTINTVRSPMTMVFSHSSQAKKIRETEGAGGGELKYRPDKTVDYVASLGADKTGTTLSPGNQNIVGEFNAERKGGDADVTHLRLVGAGEGRAQQTVNFVPQDDPFDYENDPDFDNVNRYTAAHWSSGDRKEWEVRSNKDHTDIDSLERLGETITSDVQEAHIEASANIRGLTVNLGDEFTVDYPEENISQSARVVDMTTKISSQGTTYQVTLSSRQQSLEDPDSDQRKDTDRYNLAFEGSPVTLTTGGGRQPVNSSNNYEFSFYYPAEVKFEHRVELFIKGLRYRAYSQGAAAGGNHTHSVTVGHPSHSHSVNVTHPSHSHSVSVTHPSHSHTVDVTHPSHAHDVEVTHPNHAHEVLATQTSNQKNYQGSFLSSEFQMADNAGTVTPTAFTFTNINTNNDVWITVTGTVDSGFSEPVAVFLNMYDGGSTAGGTVDSVNMDRGSPEAFSGTVAVGENDRSSSDVTIEVDAQNLSGPVSIKNTTASLIGVAQHDHSVPINTTTGTELGTTTAETSDTELGNTEAETSNTALGSTETETSDTALGSTQAETSDAALGTTTSETSDASGDHTHAVNPGIIETSDFPSNCDVIVNGSPVGVSLGDGASSFEERVDIAGLLTPGQVNTIEISSDTLGHIQAHMDIDVYRQILGDG